MYYTIVQNGFACNSGQTGVESTITHILLQYMSTISICFAWNSGHGKSIPQFYKVQSQISFFFKVAVQKILLNIYLVELFKMIPGIPISCIYDNNWQCYLRKTIFAVNLALLPDGQELGSIWEQSSEKQYFRWCFGKYVILF